MKFDSGSREGKRKTLRAKVLGGSLGNSTSSLAVFYVEQVALNRHVSPQPQLHLLCLSRRAKSIGDCGRLPGCLARISHSCHALIAAPVGPAFLGGPPHVPCRGAARRAPAWQSNAIPFRFTETDSARSTGIIEFPDHQSSAAIPVISWLDPSPAFPKQ